MYPPPPELDFTALTSWPVQPFDTDLIRAHSYVGAAWDGTRTSYFRDLVLISEKEARAQALVKAQIEDRDFMPDLPIPSGTEYLSGGAEGAIARSSEAAIRVEKRIRETRSRIGKGPPKSLEELRGAISSGSGGVGLMPQYGAPLYISELFADQARAKGRLAPRLFQG